MSSVDLKRVLKWSAVSLAVALGCGAANACAEYYAVSPQGSSSILTVARLIVVAPLCLAVVAAPLALLGCLHRRTRTVCLPLLAPLAIFMVVGIASARLGASVRMNGFHVLAKRSTTLVDAVTAYDRAHGKPPAALSDLIPEFLAAVPRTGMGSYPDYRYGVNKPRRYHGNPWVLYVSTSSGILDFDMFIYYPDQNYPKCFCGNLLERVADWAYVHE